MKLIEKDRRKLEREVLLLSLARLPVPPLPHGGSILAVAAVLFHRDFERRLTGRGLSLGRVQF
jgi:hypothetical protein